MTHTSVVLHSFLSARGKSGSFRLKPCFERGQDLRHQMVIDTVVFGGSRSRPRERIKRRKCFFMQDDRT